MKIAAGSPLLAGQLNVDALMEQAHRVDKSVNDDVSKLIAQAVSALPSHILGCIGDGAGG